jgi:hypothetical protein
MADMKRDCVLFSYAGNRNGSYLQHIGFIVKLKYNI